MPTTNLSYQDKLRTDFVKSVQFSAIKSLAHNNYARRYGKGLNCITVTYSLEYIGLTDTELQDIKDVFGTQVLDDWLLWTPAMERAEQQFRKPTSWNITHSKVLGGTAGDYTRTYSNNVQFDLICTVINNAAYDFGTLLAVNDTQLVENYPATIAVLSNDTLPYNPNGLNYDIYLYDGNVVAKSITVPGEGQWTIDNWGNATFAAEIGFITDPTLISYVIYDRYYRKSNYATITLTKLFTPYVDTQWTKSWQPWKMVDVGTELWAIQAVDTGLRPDPSAVIMRIDKTTGNYTTFTLPFTAQDIAYYNGSVYFSCYEGSWTPTYGGLYKYALDTTQEAYLPLTAIKKFTIANNTIYAPQMNEFNAANIYDRLVYLANLNLTIATNYFIPMNLYHDICGVHVINNTLIILANSSGATDSTWLFRIDIGNADFQHNDAIANVASESGVYIAGCLSASKLYYMDTITGSVIAYSYGTTSTAAYNTVEDSGTYTSGTYIVPTITNNVTTDVAITYLGNCRANYYENLDICTFVAGLDYTGSISELHIRKESDFSIYPADFTLTGGVATNTVPDINDTNILWVATRTRLYKIKIPTYV